MRFKTVGNKTDKAFIVIKNDSATQTIPNGAPCYFQMNNTNNQSSDNGLAVINANAAAGVGQNFFAGVVASEQQAGAGNVGIAPGSVGEAQVYGFCQSLRLIRQTRATSTDSYASAASNNIGDWLVPMTNSGGVTTYDAYSDIGSNLTASANSTVNALTLPNLNQYAVLAQTLASLASSASSVFSTGASSTLLMNVVLVNAFLSAL